MSSARGERARAREQKRESERENASLMREKEKALLRRFEARRGWCVRRRQRRRRQRHYARAPARGPKRNRGEKVVVVVKCGVCRKGVDPKRVRGAAGGESGESDECLIFVLRT